jgi:hypothetical protein
MSRSMAVIVAGVLFAGVAALQGTPTPVDEVFWLGDAVRVQDRLPPGHPPIPSRGLPEGHPPIGPAYPVLPEGHPPIPWPRQGCPGLDFGPGSRGSEVPVGESPEVVST